MRARGKIHLPRGDTHVIESVTYNRNRLLPGYPRQVCYKVIAGRHEFLVYPVAALTRLAELVLPAIFRIQEEKVATIVWSVTVAYTKRLIYAIADKSKINLAAVAIFSNLVIERLMEPPGIHYPEALYLLSPNKYHSPYPIADVKIFKVGVVA